jgi:hypothetical protein
VSVSNFIPTLWAGEILSNLNKAQVFAQPGVCNRDYEGEIRQFGDSVKIGAIGPVSVAPYVRNTDMSAPDALNDASTTLIIDQAQAFNIQVDDLDMVQSNVDLVQAGAREASYALSNAQDADIAGLYTDADSANLIGSSGSPVTDLATAGKPYEYVATLKQLLDEANVPGDGRWLIAPPWFYRLLVLDSKFNASPATDITSDVIRNGDVGRRVMGFTMLMSNNVKNYASTNYAIMAGYPGAITLAEQIVKVEGLRMTSRFADQLRGLLVYGRKVVRPGGLAVLFAQKA